MTDKTVQIGSSLIQYGPYNDRIYLMEWGGDDPDSLSGKLICLAGEENYSKIIVRVPELAKEAFIKKGYGIEASIPSFYNGKEDGYFLSYFLDHSREKIRRGEYIKKVLSTAMEKAVQPVPASLKKGLNMKAAEEEDLHEIADLYKRVFPDYPFPIYDPVFLKKSMNSGHNRYFMIRNSEKIIAASSVEMYRKESFAEMTDFATLPDYRGHSLARHLLKEMESFSQKEGFITAFTIARAVSYGMNITFSRMGYHYAGTLINNTRIGQGIESMNIWFKRLSSRQPVDGPVK